MLKMKKGTEVPDTAIIGCKWCGKSASIKIWDLTSYCHCSTLEMQKDYISLTFLEAYLASSDTYYCCPHCGEWIEGSILVDDDIEDIEDIEDEEILVDLTH